MRSVLTLVVIAAMLTTALVLQAKETPVADGNLVFEGTVSSIEIVPLPESLKNFVVTMRVDRVVKGQFKGKSFQFRIHSPSLSELEVGKKYTVEAQRTKDGYTVDQYQWTSPKPLVVALFSEGREAVITPYPQLLKALGLTADQLEPLRRKRLRSGKWIVDIDGKKVNLADVATITERDLVVEPFTVQLPDGREAHITPDAKKIGRYLITGEAFEENVRVHLSVTKETDPAKVNVLEDITVPGGEVPNYWKSDRVHRSTGEPLESLAKVEVQAKPANPSQTPKSTP
jgi:hypothetical protein